MAEVQAIATDDGHAMLISCVEASSTSAQAQETVPPFSQDDHPSLCSVTAGGPLLSTTHIDYDPARDRVREEEEQREHERFPFVGPLGELVRCPSCNSIHAVDSRPTTASAVASTAPAVPQPQPTPLDYVGGSLPDGANLSVEEALRHFQRCRFRCADCQTDFCRCGSSPYHWGWSCDGWQGAGTRAFGEVLELGKCRWCAKPCMAKLRRSESLASMCCGSEEDLDLQRSPPSLSCAEKERRTCGKRHANCDHWCGGVRGETQCLPCLHPECRAKQFRTTDLSLPSGATAVDGRKRSSPKQLASESEELARAQLQSRLPESSDRCSICWTETLNDAPAIRLGCEHVLHLHCVLTMIHKGSIGGKRLTFKNICCPLCQAIMHHPAISDAVSPHLALYKKVQRMALQRWVLEKRKPQPTSSDPAAEEFLAGLAMQKMDFYMCAQCSEPYYGGERECAGALAEDEEMEDLPEDVQAALAMEHVCRGCASKGQHRCPEHGTEFLGWKCRYCCEHQAEYFCFGNTHFCQKCHTTWQKGMEERRELQLGRPCLGKGRCIMGGRHPSGCKNGRDEYALGCTVCAQDIESACVVQQEKQEKQEERRSIVRFSRNCSIM